ncbi:MAG: DNA primase small subunit PriS [Candidatus Bathyarchaeota archaeon]|nr:DNA primase small subunit PriS [Candidatus Bathyarchaeota archaeon]
MAAFSQEVVYTKFSEFYKTSSEVLPLPTLAKQREFAFLLFKERVMIRHRNFPDLNRLKTFLNETVPSDIYHSCAYYENPEAEMDRKGWLGADLVFDIDADHIPTSCNKIHDEWTCGKCGFNGKGITPENCPICGSQKFDAKTWPCDQCLNSAKEETAKLIDMLEKDFGFSPKELHVFFSGHRGYHVHVENETVRTLDAIARKEIVDYVSGLGLTVLTEKTKAKTRKKGASNVFGLHDFGWNKRLKRGMQKFILNAAKEDLRHVGVRSYAAVLQNKEAILKRCLEENRWTSVKGVSIETWARIAEHVKNLESAKIDTVVTSDIHRLIRMAGTLHGKTGLKKIEFPAARLMEFDPFKEAVAFKDGTVKVFVSDVPEFRLGESMFGPYRRQAVELPTAAAVLLICKGRAEDVS